MTSTDHLQKLPDFYNSQEECKNNKMRTTTNPRYSSYDQIYFTAGDVDQFQQYRDPSNGDGSTKTIGDNNVWKNYNIEENIDWEKYKNLSTESVDNTFLYLFNKFKKGVFVKIKNNKLSVFLPFSKVNFTNEWDNRILLDPTLGFKSMVDFLIYLSKLQGYNVKPENIQKNISSWYSNNCLVRYEYPPQENDKGLSIFKDMLLTLCSNRSVPDIEFFLNRRDFPLIKKNDSEPYEQLFDSDKFPLVSHKYSSYSPILSMVTTDNNADIPIPTWEDWARISSQEEEKEKFFRDNCRSYRYDFNEKWKNKIPTAVFRGASTGCGTTVESNPRLMVSYLSTVAPIENGYSLLDAGITKWNLRPRKNMGSPYLQFIDPKTLPFQTVKILSPEEQSKYKYIVNIDGHVSAFRLSLELSMGSVILLVNSRYKLWFMKYLQEYVHYVPILPDLSDLFDKIRWCRENDEKCKEIAQNALNFYNKFLKKDGVLDYLQLLMFKLKEINGEYFYNTVKIVDIIQEKQKLIVSKYKESIEEVKEVNHQTVHFYPPNMSLFHAMEAIQLYIKNIKKIPSIIDSSLIYKSKNTYVQSGSLFGLPVVLKNTVNNNTNEIFTGLTSINPLVRLIPNFRYTYYSDENTTLFQGIKGDTFQKYINSGCSIDDIVGILMIICLSLSVAQEQVGFVHYDLYPWNVVLEMRQKKKVSTYKYNNLIFTVETNIVPVIIDYERSHVIYDNQHYGSLFPFETRVFQDCFSILINTINEILIRPKRIEQIELKKMIYAINFFTGTSFYKKQIENYEDLVVFVNKYKKYNEMIYGNKCDLETKGAIDLFFHLSNLPVSSNFNIVQLNYPDKIPAVSEENMMFYYDIIVGNKSDFVGYLNNLEKCLFSLDCKSVLSFTTFCNLVNLKIKSIMTYPFVEEEVILKSKSLLKKIDLFFNDNIGKKSFNIRIKSYDKIDKLMLANYNTKTFEQPSKILTIIQGLDNIKENKNTMVMKDFLIWNLTYDLPYKIPKSDTFFRKYKEIIDINTLYIKNFVANNNSIKEISKVVYKQDINFFSKMESKPTETINIMKSIINIIE